MSDWSTASAIMDGIVDDTLSDDIGYAIAGAPFITLPGYVEFDSPSLTIDEIDELATRPRLKIAKSLVQRPTQADRIRCLARLGVATYRPVAKVPRDQGRYWVIDLQKVTP